MHCAQANIGRVTLVAHKHRTAFDLDPADIAVLIVTTDVLGWLHSLDEGHRLLYRRRWLRLVVDEGHTMGRGANTNARRAIAALYTDRKWVVTGTPTPSTVTASGLSHLHKLLDTIGEPPFDANRNLWRALVQHPFDRHLAADAVWRLHTVLSRVMVRHSKDILARLPPPLRQTVLLPMAPSERDAYNAVVAVIRANVVLTAMEGRVQGKMDSLLHETQTRFAREALVNSRIACCGGARRLCDVDLPSLEETCGMLLNTGVSDARVSRVREQVRLSATGRTFPCDACGLPLLVLLVMPCACMCCAECVTNTSRACPVCRAAFDVDHFQLLQPGVTPVADEHELGLPTPFSPTALLDTLDAFDHITQQQGLVTCLPRRANAAAGIQRAHPRTLDLEPFGTELVGAGGRLGTAAAGKLAASEAPQLYPQLKTGAASGVSGQAPPTLPHRSYSSSELNASAPVLSMPHGETPATSTVSVDALDPNTAPMLPAWARSCVGGELLPVLQYDCLRHTKARHIIQTVLSLLRKTAETGQVGNLVPPTQSVRPRPAPRVVRGPRAHFAEDTAASSAAASAQAATLPQPTRFARPYIKCIVFSQFGQTHRSPLALVGDKLVRVFGMPTERDSGTENDREDGL